MCSPKFKGSSGVTVTNAMSRRSLGAATPANLALRTPAGGRRNPTDRRARCFSNSHHCHPRRRDAQPSSPKPLPSEHRGQRARDTWAVCLVLFCLDPYPTAAVLKLLPALESPGVCFWKCRFSGPTPSLQLPDSEWDQDAVLLTSPRGDSDADGPGSTVKTLSSSFPCRRAAGVFTC